MNFDLITELLDYWCIQVIRRKKFELFSLFHEFWKEIIVSSLQYSKRLILVNQVIWCFYLVQFTDKKLVYIIHVQMLESSQLDLFKLLARIVGYIIHKLMLEREIWTFLFSLLHKLTLTFSTDLFTFTYVRNGVRKKENERNLSCYFSPLLLSINCKIF